MLQHDYLAKKINDLNATIDLLVITLVIALIIGTVFILWIGELYDRIRLLKAIAASIPDAEPVDEDDDDTELDDVVQYGFTVYYEAGDEAGALHLAQKIASEHQCAVAIVPQEELLPSAATNYSI